MSEIVVGKIEFGCKIKNDGLLRLATCKSSPIRGAAEIDATKLELDNVVRYKIRQRHDRYTEIFLRYEDRIERWILGYDPIVDRYYPLCRQAANYRGGRA